jgi:hypothetical protein
MNSIPPDTVTEPLHPYAVPEPASPLPWKLAGSFHLEDSDTDSIRIGAANKSWVAEFNGINVRNYENAAYILALTVAHPKALAKIDEQQRRIGELEGALKAVIERIESADISENPKFIASHTGLFERARALLSDS